MGASFIVLNRYAHGLLTVSIARTRAGGGVMIDYDERDRAVREDREFFDRYPDREYRLRSAWRCEFSTGNPPAGFGVFAILHRRDQEPTQIFGAPITFETDRTDADIRSMIAALAQDPRAMLTAKR